MYKEILINVEPQEKRIAILEDRKLEEFYVERKTRSALVGNIYKGKVNQIVPGIGAAFIDISLEKNGFLYVSDIVHPLIDYEEITTEEPLSYGVEKTPKKVPNATPNIETLLKKGQEILVQVVKEPFGTKGVRLTTHITLPGRYLVLMPYDPHKGISKRIEDGKERNRLKNIISRLNLPKDMGFIVRTAGADKGKREFVRDIKYLVNLWHRIKKHAEGLKPPSLVHQEYDLVIRIIRDSFTEDINKVIVDSRDEYRKISHFLNSIQPGLRSRLKFYQGNESIFDKKIETAIENIYHRKVPLKSGGYIIIEPTEGLVAIDVNTGKFAGRKRLEETAYQVNREAAQEVARQIRLRDIGGIIVIDFIDMESELYRKKVFLALEEALRRDRAKTNILQLSEMGLVEMTRQRRRLNLESVSYEFCPYCKGRGSVKSPITTSISAIRKIKTHFRQTGIKEVFVLVHPEVASYLLKEDRSSIFEIENKFKSKIIVMADPNIHIEEVRIKSTMPNNVKMEIEGFPSSN